MKIQCLIFNSVKIHIRKKENTYRIFEIVYFFILVVKKLSKIADFKLYLI